LKVKGDEQSVTNSGKLFQARGPATAKALSPLSKWWTTCCWHQKSGWRWRPQSTARQSKI